MAAEILAIHAFWTEPASLRLAQYDVPVPGAPRLAGLRIAVISDLHGGAYFIDEAKIDLVTAMTNAAHPDLILLTGDYVVSIYKVYGGHHMPIETIAAHLKPLKAPLGVYAVLGNHDRWEDGDHIAAVLRRNGIEVLENRNITLETPRGPVHLAGVGDFYSGASHPTAALSGIAPGAKALCFTHSPDVFPRLPGTCALTIAGHTHGGQVKLPWVGPIIVPSLYLTRYAAGRIVERGHTLFVSTGIGTSILPVRYHVPPEISLLTIR